MGNEAICDVEVEIPFAEMKRVGLKPIADKLGVRPGQRNSIDGKLDATFVADSTYRGADVSERVRAGGDIIFFVAESRKDLERLVGIRDSLAANGAHWIMRPKASAAISEPRSDACRESDRTRRRQSRAVLTGADGREACDPQKRS